MSISSNLVWGYLDRWGNKIISLFVFVVLARLLDPVEFGLIAFARLFIEYLENLTGQGLDTTIIQKQQLVDADISTAFWINIFLSIIFSLLLFTLSPYISSYFSETELTSVLRALIISIVLSAMSRVQIALLIREKKFKSLSLRGLAMSVSGGLVGIILAVKGFGVWSLVFQQIVSNCVAVLILWGVSSWRPNFIFSISSMKEMYKYSSRVIVNTQVSYISYRIDEALISLLLGISELGYYSVAKKLLVTLSDLFYSVLSKVLLSVLSRLQENKKEIIKNISMVTTIISAVSFPILLISSLSNKNIIYIIFGDKWLSAAPVLSVFMIAGLFLLTPNVAQPLFNSIGRPGISLKINIIRAILSIITISVGAIFGLIGVAFGVLVGHVLGSSLDVFYMNKYVESVTKKFVIPQFLSVMYCMPMLLFIYMIFSYYDITHINTGYFLISIVSGLVIYVLTLIIFKAPAINFLYQFIRRNKVGLNNI